MSDGLIQVARVDTTEYIRFRGIVRYSHCSGLEVHIDHIFQNPSFEHVVIDLTPAEILDSTALGLMAKIAIELRKIRQEPAAIIVGEGELKNILKRVCFDQVFLMLSEAEIKNHSFVNRKESDYAELVQLPVEEEQLLETVIKAHQNLVRLSKSNESLFKDITNGFH